MSGLVDSPAAPRRARAWSLGAAVAAGLAVALACGSARAAGSRTPRRAEALSHTQPPASQRGVEPPVDPPPRPPPDVRAPQRSLGAAVLSALPPRPRAWGLYAPAPTPPASEPAVDPEPEPEPAPTASKLLRKRSIPPFWIDRRFDTHRTTAIAFPPLYVHRKPAPDYPEKFFHANLALTFGWYAPAKQAKRWLSPLALFYGSFSRRKTLWATVPLLMAYRRVGEQFNFGQFPLVWWWGTKYVKNLLVVPFHYQQKTPDSFRGVSALLFWYGHKDLDDLDRGNDRRHFVAAPVFWRFRRGLKEFDFGFLYLGGKNEGRGKVWRSFAPFVVWQNSEFGNRRELWTLAWVRRTDRARRKSAWAVPLAMTFSHATPERRVLSVTPLVWSSQNHRTGGKTLVAGPYIGYRDDRSKNHVVLPLYFRFEDRRARAATSVLAPFYVARRTSGSFGVYTFLGGGARTKNGYVLALPPLLSGAAKLDDGRKRQVALGLFVHAWDPNRQKRTVVLAPLGWASRRPERFSLGIPPALVFAGRKGTKRWQTVTPLFWHVRDPAQERRTLVGGPFYHHRNRTSRHTGLAPLAFFGANERFRYNIAPFLLLGDVYDVREDRRLTITPFVVMHRSPGARTLGVLALAWDVQRDSGNERHTAVVPLFYRRRIGDRALWVTPIGGSYRKGSDRWTLVGPFVQRKVGKRNGWGVLPFLFVDRHPTEGGIARHVVVPPLVLVRRTPKSDLDMWTPLLWRTKVRGEKPRTGLAAIPFYFRQRQKDGVDVDASFSFFWSRDRRRRTHTVIAGPVFHRLTRKHLHAGVAPLYWWHDSLEKRRLLSFPAIFHFEDKVKREHTTVAVPLWFDRLRANGRRAWGVFPFVFGGKRLYNFTRFSLAPPGFVDAFRINRNMRFTGFVPLLFRYRKCGYRIEDEPSCQYTLWGSAPLFLYGKDGQGRVTHGAALLYYFDKRKDGWRLYTPLFGVRNQPGKVLGWYGGPLAVKTTQTHRRVMFFPLYFRRKHRLEDRSLTLVAPPLFVQRHRKDRRFFEAGLVVWQFRQQHKVTTTILPPVFYHSHSWAQRRTTWLLPLFVRDNDVGDDEAWTSILPAGYVQRRNGADLDIVQFPLVWHIERGENQGTFGAFVWWDIRVKGKMAQVVPGVFTRAAGPHLDIKVIGPGLAWWANGKGEREGDRAWRMLFGLFGGGVENGERYAVVFGARVRRGPAKPTPPRGQRGVRGKARARRVKG